MKKILNYFLLFMFMMFPVSIFALENDDNVVAMTEKYYKTTTLIGTKQNNTLDNIDNYYTYTEEVTKEEYDAYKTNMIEPQAIVTVETTYKKLKSYITQRNTYYRYNAVLEWKSFPKVRSHDVIAIGHFASVKLKGNVHFEQEYCDKDNNCRTLSAYQPRTFTAGSSASFKLPAGDLTSLKQTIYFDVEKAVDATVIKQNASGDYAHAIKSINLMEAISHTVSNSGIQHIDSCKDSFDSMTEATATWQGSW